MPRNIPMDLLRNLVAIVNAGSLTRASEHVHRSPSALSLQMKRLSDFMGQPIFNKFHGKLLLTPAGETLLTGARDLIIAHDKLLFDLFERDQHWISLGVTPLVSDVFLRDILSELTKSVPQLSLNLVTDNSSILIDMVDRSLLDIAIYFDRDVDENVIMPLEVFLVGKRSLVEKDVLPIALPSLGREGKGMHDAQTREAVVNALDQANRKYSIVLECTTASALVAAVNSGIAIASLPEKLLGNSEFVTARVFPDPIYEISLCMKTHKNPNPFVDLLSGILSEYISNK